MEDKTVKKHHKMNLSYHLLNILLYDVASESEITASNKMILKPQVVYIFSNFT